MFLSYSQGASALALAIAFNSRNVSPGKAQEGPVQEFPTVEVAATGQAAQASAPSDQLVLGVLNPRERRIFEARRLADEPMTLDALSDEFDISRERVRQTEVRAFEKIQSAVKYGVAKPVRCPRRGSKATPGRRRAAGASRGKNVTSGRKPVRWNLDFALPLLIASRSPVTVTLTVEENVAAPV